ncbi:MAG: hypothetical protein QME79_11465 [Bacillota bacterium]|nr:hypothetical protein [Bacillota bacterium]
MSAEVVTYFDGEGREYLPLTVKAVVKYLKAHPDVQKVIVFTAEGEGPLALKKAARGMDVKVIAVTYPFGQSFKADADRDDMVVTGIVDQSIRAKLKSQDVEIVQGSMPFQDIMIPGSSDPKIQTIIHTLRLFGGGTVLCIQAAVMACDAGVVAPGEEVVAMAADTALVLRAARKLTMFHPSEGMDVKEIICKPRTFTVTRRRSGDSVTPEGVAASKH